MFIFVEHGKTCTPFPHRTLTGRDRDRDDTLIVLLSLNDIIISNLQLILLQRNLMGCSIQEQNEKEKKKGVLRNWRR